METYFSSIILCKKMAPEGQVAQLSCLIARDTINRLGSTHRTLSLLHVRRVQPSTFLRARDLHREGADRGRHRRYGLSCRAAEVGPRCHAEDFLTEVLASARAATRSRLALAVGDLAAFGDCQAAGRLRGRAR